MKITHSAGTQSSGHPPRRREQRARTRRQRVAGVIVAALLGTSAAAFGPLAVASPALAAGTPHGEVVGIVEWPADADLHAGGVWGGGDFNLIVGTTGTPTTAIKRFNVNAAGGPTGTRNSYNLGVSAHAVNPGIYATAGLNLGGRSAASPEALAHYGFANTVWVDWSPSTDNGSGEKGKTYSIEIPSPTVAEANAAGKPIHRDFTNSSCGMEVNPYTSELVILNNCTANENRVQYLVLNPGPDGDPLTMEDNSFDWFIANPLTANGGAVSDMTIDALGNVYNFLSPTDNRGTIVRTDAQTGLVTTVGEWNQGPGEPTGRYEWVSLAFLDGKMVVPTANINSGQKLFAVDPLTGKAEAIPGYTPGLLNRNYVNYDGAGVEGAVGLQGKVVDVNGTGLENQTVAIYQDNGDGTATLQGSRPTDANGEYAALLNWSNGVGYVRVVQPQLTTGAGAAAEVKNGEVVAAEVATLVNDNTNSIEVLNEGNNGVNPPLGTPLTTTISVADTDDLVKITGNNASVFYTADFTVAFAGSTADLSRNSLLGTDATAGNGPQHLNVAGDSSGDLRLGATNGEYTVGATDNSHASDDGVFLNLAGDTPLAKDQLFASGQTYPMRAVSEGAQAANAKVGAWLSAAGAQNANPRGAFGDGVFGTGATVDFDLVFPSTAGFSTLRVNSSLADVTKPDNTLGEYAATAATSGTKPWTTPGEVEDYDVKTVSSVVRVSAESSVTGSYAYTLTGVSTTAPSTTTAEVVVSDAGEITPSSTVHEGTVGTDVVVSPTATPAGTVLKSAKIIDALTGDEIADATFTSAGVVTIPGTAVTMGSDIRVVLTYSEDPSAEDSSLELAPATAEANGTSSITATVTVVGGVSGEPLAGQVVKIVADPANADVTVSNVTDNGDGTYTATITSSVPGTYPIAATVEIAGSDEAVSGSPADAVFIAGAPSATESVWEIDKTGPLQAGSGAGSTYTATATVKDATGNAVGAGVDVSFTVPAGVNGFTEETVVVVPTDASGVASLALVSSVAGEYVFTAGLGAEQIGASETRAWTAAAADTAHSEFSVTSGVKTADGTAQHVLTAAVADEFDNPVSGEEVTFTLPAGAEYAGTTAGTWVSGTTGTIVVATDAAGAAAIGVTSTVAATYSVAGAIGAGTLPGSPADIEFGAGEVDASASSWEITPAGPIAAGGTYTVTVIAKDSSGNPVAGADVALALPADVTIVGGGAATGTSGADGTVVFEITSTVKGSHDVSATIGGDPVGGAGAGTKSVEFTAAAADTAHSEFSVTSGVKTADGTAQHVLTAAVADEFDNPVSGEEVTFTLPAGAEYAGTTAGTWVSGTTGTIVVATDAAGAAAIGVTSTVAATYSVAGAIGAGTLPGSPADIEFGAGEVDASASSWEITPAGPIAAGGTYTVTVIAKDSSGNPVAGADVALALPADVTIVGGGAATGTSGADGTVVFEITSTVKGSHDVSATIGGDPVGGAGAGTKSVEFTAAAPDASQSAMTATTGVVTADGTASHKATAKVKDSYGNTVGAGVTVTFTFPADVVGAGGASPQTVVTDTDGKAALQLTSVVAGTYEVAATIDVAGTATAISGSPVSVEFGSGGASAANSTWEITPAYGTVAAGGTYTAKVTVRDATDNLVEGEVVTFEFPSGVNGTGVTSGTATTGADGVASFELTSETAWVDFPIAALVAGTAVDPATIPIQFTAGSASLETSTIVVDPTTIDVGSEPPGTATVTVQLKDAFGNDVHDNTATVVIETSVGTITATAAAGSDTGSYTAELSGTTADLVDGQATTADLSFTVDGAEATATASAKLIDDTAPLAPTVDSTDGGVVTGTAEPGSTVVIRDPDTGDVLCETTADPTTGAFACGSADQPLQPGKHEVVAVDPGGNESPSTPITVAKPPVVDSTDGGVVTGEGEPGDTIEVRDPDTGEVLCSTVVKPDGTFECGPIEGGGDLEVVQIDPDGNESAPIEITVTKPPVVDSTDGGVITGEGEPGDTIEVRDPDTGDVLCSTTVKPDGTFECGPIEGGGDLEVVQIDPDGNESAPIEITVTKPPKVDSTDGGVITGEGESGDTIEVRDPDTGEVLCSTVVKPDGSFECGPIEGGGDLEVVQIDPDGNESAPIEITVTKPPVVDSTDGGVITGEGEPGDTIEVRDPDTGEVLCSTVVKPDGTFECGPIEGGGDLEVVQIDPDGNESAPIEITVTKPPKVDSTDGGVITGEGEPGDTIEVRDPDTGEVLCS
ncbi:Ig-like domain-containing protein, partial [Leucobacter sp. NPDC015123]|uniref:Ig-like domain-containing protein n=1 Tax=Leucobacter sp. NPDC015123 TaxID=3364129 RepID=UPI0036F49691